MNKTEMLTQIDKLPLFELNIMGSQKAKRNADGTINDNPDFRWAEDKNWRTVTEIGKDEILAGRTKRYVLTQFKELFTPIVEQIENFDGELKYFHGYSVMDIFPNDTAYNLGDNKIGVSAYTAVTGLCALNIKFCVMDDKRVISIPSRIAHFRKIHVGKIKQKTQDYISLISTIKNAWSSIVNKFCEYNVTEENLIAIANGLHLTDKALEYMKDKVKEHPYNLWDFCMEVFDYISSKSYKSDIHKRKALDKFANKIFDYQLAVEI